MHPAASEIVDTVNRLFTAMRERDVETMRALIHPRATIFSMRPGELRARTAEEFIEACADAKEAIDERIRDAEIRIDADVADLWAPYDVHFGTRYSHSGCDAFQFVRLEGAWKLVGATYSVRS